MTGPSQIYRVVVLKGEMGWDGVIGMEEGVEGSKEAVKAKGQTKHVSNNS